MERGTDGRVVPRSASHDQIERSLPVPYWMDRVGGYYRLVFYAEERKTIRVADFPSPPKTGTEFFNAVRDVYLSPERSTNPAVMCIIFKKKQSADDPTELGYMVMERAKEGTLGSSTTRSTCTTIEINNSPRYPHGCSSVWNWPKP